MQLSALISELQQHLSKQGDIPVVLYDEDTSYYFKFTSANIELQRMQDDTLRLSIGVNSYSDPREDEPKER